mgnify:CR=1 FL=1
MAQEVSFEKEDITLLEYFTDLHDIPNPEARKELARVLFVKDDINKKIGSLSGGEKSRLKLCSLMYDKVNLMILDEPTNHLDIDSREILEETLINYEGTILFVSHDRYFIAKIANRMAEIVKESIEYYAGNYDYYREQKEKSLRSTAEIVTKVNKEVVVKVKDKKKVPQKYLMEVEALEAKIIELEVAQEAIARDMEAYASDVEKLGDLYTKNDEIETNLMTHYERLEFLSDLIENGKY